MLNGYEPGGKVRVFKEVVKVDTKMVRPTMVGVYRTRVVDDSERSFKDKDERIRIFEYVF
jgi:hypothetical protein